MAATVLSAHQLGKRYIVGETRTAYRTLRDVVANWRPWQTSDHSSRSEHWALADCSFSVEQGEVLGLVGPNGAGKSTLLKILSRITRPTRGSVRIRGRVGSLLEVGTGFHPELTGRENVFLNGAILGMRRDEIRSQFDSIIDFAEIAKFVDTPVKHYSSGMYVRLAFSVAAHFKPDILLVDEVLAVGDARFQQKSLSRMKEVARSGHTVLFVSHNATAVRALCTKALFLDGGRVQAMGETSDVLSAYARTQASQRSASWARPATKAPTGRVWIESVVLRGATDTQFTVDQPIQVSLAFRVTSDSDAIPGIHVYNEEGLLLFSAADWSVRGLTPGLYEAKCTIPPFLLGAGRHSLSAFLFDTFQPAHSQLPADDIEHAVVFDVDGDAWVDQTNGRWLRTWPGALRPTLQWDTVPLEVTV